jgi:hypothetical protein
MAALIPSASATGSGTMTLAGPSTNSNQTVTIPDTTGTMMVSGNMPAFSAYLSSASQSVTSNVETVAVLNTEEFDTGGCFNNTGSTVTLNGLSTPAYAFCPNVTGYYQVSLNLRYTSTGNFTGCVAYIKKNGSQFYRWFELTSGSWVNGWSSSGSMLVYLNGTGDYIQLSGAITGISPSFENSGFQYTSRMQAVLVRSA